MTALQNRQDEIFERKILPCVAEFKGTAAGFLAIRGWAYSGELMVVGRALNGCFERGLCIDPADAKNRQRRTEFASAVRAAVTKVKGFPGCPMSWVVESWGKGKEYNTKKSAFWRTIRSTVGSLRIAEIEGDDAPWSSSLIWSNLYKLSPSGSGNPSNRACEAQQKACVELFKIELEDFRPKRILLLTGYDWAEPFLKDLSSFKQAGSDCMVDASGHLTLGGHCSNVVVAKHPQGKPENAWVDQVTKSFEALQALNA